MPGTIGFMKNNILKDLSMTDSVCSQCFVIGGAIDEVPQDCPVVMAVNTECNASPSKPTKASEAVLRLLQIGSRGDFTSASVSDELFDDSDRHLSKTTRAQRFAKAVSVIKNVMSARVLSTDVNMNPHVHMLDTDELQIWCTKQPRSESEVVQEEPKENPFKYTKELPGLTQLIHNVIMADKSDPEESKQLFNDLVENIDQARDATKRPVLVADAISLAKGRCLDSVNIKKYGKNPRAARRFAQLSLIEERLRG